MQNNPGFLDRLRAKPLNYRRTFALSVSLGFTFIVAIIWLVSTITRLSTSPANNVDQTASTPTGLSIFSVIKDQFGTVMENNPFNTDTKTESGQAGSNNQNLVQ